MSNQKESLQSCGSNGVVELSGKKIDVAIATNELVFVLYYDSQNHTKQNVSFCQEFDRVANLVRKKSPRRRKILMAKVDNQKETKLRGFLWYYHTLKLYRNGLEMNLNLSNSSLKDLIFNELEDPIKIVHDHEELGNLDRRKHLIIGYFDKEGMPEYDNFRRVAQNLKEKCNFYVKYGYSYSETSTNMRPPNQPTIIFKPAGIHVHENRVTFKGCVKNYDDLNLWAHKKCLVRELTLDNFEEIRKGIQQMLILFYNPSNQACIQDFCNIVGRSLMDKKHCINFLIADGIKFGPYLREYNKKKKDLPIIMKENGVFLDIKEISTPGVLRKFALTYHFTPKKVSLEKYVKSMRKKTNSTTSEC